MSEMAYYVYEHWRPDLNVCFYVGKGKGRRAHDFSGRNARHTRIVAKIRQQNLKIEVRIVARGLSEATAFAVECERIKSYTTLVNMTSGGEGSSGQVPSLVHRQKLSAALKGRLKSPEVRARMAAARTGMKFSPEHLESMARVRRGMPLSDAHRAKMNAAHKGRKKDPAAVEKQRQTLIGRRHTPEAIAKMSAVRIAYHAQRRVEAAQRGVSNV